MAAIQAQSRDSDAALLEILVVEKQFGFGNLDARGVRGGG